MTKKEHLKNIEIKTITNTVFINNKNFSFCYTSANDVVKEEFKNQYRYFGGLQCNYQEDSPEYKNLENWLCEIAEWVLKFTKQ